MPGERVPLRIGFRTVALMGGLIQVNGKPLPCPPAVNGDGEAAWTVRAVLATDTTWPPATSSPPPPPPPPRETPADGEGCGGGRMTLQPPGRREAYARPLVQPLLLCLSAAATPSG